MIGKFSFATPGRLGNYTDEAGEEESASGSSSSGKASGGGQPERIIALLGGRENITLVDACMTRLRVTVKDPEKVADAAAWKAEGALGLVKKDNGSKTRSPLCVEARIALTHNASGFCVRCFPQDFSQRPIDGKRHTSVI